MPFRTQQHLYACGQNNFASVEKADRQHLKPDGSFARQREMFWVNICQLSSLFRLLGEGISTVQIKLSCFDFMICMARKKNAFPLGHCHGTTHKDFWVYLFLFVLGCWAFFCAQKTNTSGFFRACILSPNNCHGTTSWEFPRRHTRKTQLALENFFLIIP